MGTGVDASAGAGVAYVFIEIHVPRGRYLRVHMHLEAAEKP